MAKHRTPIHGKDAHGNLTFIAALYAEGNLQVYWNRLSEWTGQQFSNLSLLYGMWETTQILTGVPSGFEGMKTTVFSGYYAEADNG